MSTYHTVIYLPCHPNICHLVILSPFYHVTLTHVTYLPYHTTMCHLVILSPTYHVTQTHVLMSFYQLSTMSPYHMSPCHSVTYLPPCHPNMSSCHSVHCVTLGPLTLYAATLLVARKVSRMQCRTATSNSRNMTSRRSVKN